MSLLEFVFRDLWTFIGCWILVALIVRGVVILFRGYPPIEKDDV